MDNKQSGLPNLREAMNQLAAWSSAQFIMENMMKTATPYQGKWELMSAAFDRAEKFIDANSMALEFGVGSGESLVQIADQYGHFASEGVWGFDSFDGLPEQWRPHFPKGTFAQDKPVFVDGAMIVTGLFENSLPDFMNKHNAPISFVHIDCDLYSSTKTIFKWIGSNLLPGSVLLFDEYLNYPGWESGEHRAFTEWMGKDWYYSHEGFEYVGYNERGQQVAVVLK